MSGRSINGTKYIYLNYPNDFKNKSLEDNVYFTLRDIFWNGDSKQCTTANHYNSIIANKPFEERNEEFRYENVLHDYNSGFTENLYRF
jgi:hypothetical protein